MQALNITIFGIITVSLDVGIMNVFFIQFGCVCILISYYNALWHCVNFSGKRVTAHPEGARMPILIPYPLHCLSLTCSIVTLIIMCNFKSLTISKVGSRFFCGFTSCQVVKVCSNTFLLAATFFICSKIFLFV